MSPPDDDPNPRSRTITNDAADPFGIDVTLDRGTAFGRYLLLDRLGSGAMGVVYSAYDPELDRKIALKILLGNAVGEQTRLQREGRAIARLQHGSVIAVYDVGSHAGHPFIAMELVEGTSLAAWLTEKPRSWREIVDVFLRAGRGLAAAHAAGIVHRDFKPTNVLVGHDGRVRVADFGLARSFASAEEASETTAESASASSPPSRSSSPVLDETITRAGSLVGTPTYMAAEQFAGQPASDKSDQFSFCVSLYRALYGERPFGGDVLATVAAQVVTGRLRPPPAESRVPRWVRDVVMRGLAKEPEKRWPSMDALLAALGRDPDRVRRRWLVGGGGIVALIALFIGLVWAQRRANLVCRGADRKLAGVWDDGRRRALHDAFVATHAPYAEHAAGVVTKMLDAYAGAWVAQHTAACEATRLHREQSEEVLDLRMECLGSRLQELRAQSDAFASADAKVVERSVQMASSLSSVAGCSDVAALRAPVRPPADPAKRARADELRMKVARVRTLVLSGKYQDALAMAGPVATEARALGYRPLEASALFWLGSMQDELGDRPTAQKTLEDSALAARAGRDAVQETEAWAGMVRVGKQQAHWDQAHTWARFGFAAAEAAGPADERALARLLYMVGALDGEQGHSAESLASYQKALAIRERIFGPDSSEVAGTLKELAVTYADLGRYADSEKAARRAVATGEKILGPIHPQVADSLYSLGHILHLEGKTDESLQAYKRSVSVQEQTRGPDSPYLVVPLSNIAGILGEQGKNAESLAYLKRALALGEKVYGPVHPEIAAVLMNMGELLRTEHKYDEALPLYERALAIFDKTGAPRYQAIALTLIGGDELDLKQPARAVAPLRRAVAIWATMKTGDATEPFDTKFALARALWAERPGDAESRALAAQARAGYASAGERAKSELADVDKWLAEHR